MHPYGTVSPIAQRLVQVHAIVEKIAGVNGPLHEKRKELKFIFWYARYDRTAYREKLKWETFFSLRNIEFSPQNIYDNARDLDVEISFEQAIFAKLYTHKLFSLAVT